MSKEHYQFEIPEFCLGDAVEEINRRKGWVMGMPDAKDGVITVDVEMEPEAYIGYEEWLAELIARGPGSPQETCSFCNKGKEDVKALIQGPNVSICSECVAACVEILESDNPDA